MMTDEEVALAVLPFVDVSMAPVVDPMSTKFTEVVRDVLRRETAIHVIMRAYGNTRCQDVCVTTIGRVLGVDWLLFGCVCRRHRMIHARVQLIRASTGQVANPDRVIEGATTGEIAALIACDVAWALGSQAQGVEQG